MKKLDFIKSLDHLSDGTISEAQLQRESEPKKRRPALFKYVAIAACVGVVIMSGILIGKNINIDIDRDENITTASDNSTKPVAVKNDELQKIPMPVELNGAGDGGVFAKDISEIEVTGLTEADILPDMLPVYRNDTKWYGGMYPDHTDYDKMLETLKKYAEFYGLDTESLEITEENTFDEYTGDDLDELFGSLYGIPAPKGVYQPQAIEATQNGITVRVSGEYSVTVWFETPEPIEGIEGYDGTDYDSVLAAAEYIKSAYADKLMLSDPVVHIGGGTRNVYGEVGYGISFYEASDSIAEKLYNKSFRSVSVYINEYGLSSIHYSIINTEHKVGDYPLITPDEALEEFENGNYIDAVDSDDRSIENVARMELVYRGATREEYYIPCYKLYVYHPDAPIESQMSMHLYDIYYVPAIEPRYIECSETSSEVKILEPFSVSDIPQYQNVGYYDESVRDFKPATATDESLEYIFNDSYLNAQIGSFYKVRVTGAVSDEDKTWLNGYNVGSGDDQATFYYATVLYDYFAAKSMYKRIIFRMSGSIEMQDSGSPPFTVGDNVALLLYRDSERSDFNRAFTCYAFVYDVEHINGAEYLLARGQRVPELENGLTNYLTDGTAEVVTSTTINPAVYHGAYDPAELSKKLKNIIDDVEKMPLENLVENKYGPGSLAYGGDFIEYPINAGTLNVSGKPEHQDAEISEPFPATGEPQSFDELLHALSPDTNMLGVAYEITNIYTYEETVNLYREFYPHRTLYRAHAFYDVLNDKPLDYYFDVAGWGSTEWQEEGWPMYAEGDRLLSFFDEPSESGYELPESYLEFMLFEVDGVKMAYHIGNGNIHFEGDEYPNLDLEMSDSERTVVTTNADNPIIFTQKSTLQSLSSFMRDTLYQFGLANIGVITLPKLVVERQSASLGVSGDTCTLEDISELDKDNPLGILDFTEDITVPVYRRKMWRNISLNGMIEGVDRDFMREALEFYAIGFGFDPNSIVIEDDRMTPEQVNNTAERAHIELPGEYGEPTKMWFEQDGVKVEIYVTDQMIYRVDIDIEEGFNLSDGAKVGLYSGATREEAERAEIELIMQYEWLIGFNDAGSMTVCSGGEDRCYVSMYHSPVGYDMIPDEDGSVPKESEEAVIKAIINRCLNSISFVDDGKIYCFGIPYGFETQYEKLGDYPLITPEKAMELLDQGGYVSTPIEETGKTSEDVVYTELVYLEDGIPYYKFYVPIDGWREYTEGDCGAYYVPAVDPDYVDIVEPSDGGDVKTSK